MFLTQWLSWQRKLRNIDDTQLGQGLSSLPVHEEGTKLPLNYSYNSISAATFNLIFIKLCALVNSIPENAGHERKISAVLDCHFGHDMRGLRQYYEDASVKERRPLTVLSRGFALANILNRRGTGTGLPLWYSPGMGCESFNHPSMLPSNGYLNELLKCPPSTAQPPRPRKLYITHFTLRSRVSFRFDVPLLALFNFVVHWYLNSLQAQSMPHASAPLQPEPTTQLP